MKEVPKEPKKLREGYTTGACATAATRAALLTLISGEVQDESTIYLPVGRFATFHLEECEYRTSSAVASIIKDAGDDPDATHGALIISEVSWCNGADIIIDGGVGVGRVIKPGLPVPEGEEMAKKTLNARLGILGGISILGTRGIVVPFSTAAYKASIVQAISVAKASNCEHVVITTGGRSEKYGMKQFPELPEEAFIEMGDFVGFTLKQCKKQGMKKVSLVGMMGKFSKVAQGVMMVHSKSAPIDFNFLAKAASESGASAELVEEIKGANTASQVGDLMTQSGHHQFFEKLCEYCCLSALKEVGDGIDVDTSLYTLKGDFIQQAVQHGN